MRDKISGWSKWNYSWSLKDDKERVVVIPQNKNPFMNGFISNLTIRPSCFRCQFKGINRITDITLGDYWGVWDHLPEMDDDKGTSLVLIHTEQGMKLFNKISNKITLADAVIEKAIKGNPCIVESTKYNPKREEFFRRLGADEDFIMLIDELTANSLRRKIKKNLLSLFKKK